METILFIVALVAIFAGKAFSIVKWHDDEIDKSVAFSWTKPGMKESIEVPELLAEEPAHVGAGTTWSPSRRAAA